MRGLTTLISLSFVVVAACGGGGVEIDADENNVC
jgi:hypothetical protein